MVAEETREAGPAYQVRKSATAISYSLGGSGPWIRISSSSPSTLYGQRHALPFPRWNAAASLREARNAFRVRLPGRQGMRNSDAMSHGGTRSQFAAIRVPSSLRRS